MVNLFRTQAPNTGDVRRILLFRIGSLGDTCVAIPAFRLLRNCYPSAHIRCLTNFPVATGIKAAPLASIIGQSGLVDDYLEYAIGARGDALALLRQIRAWSPDLLVYLMPQRSPMQLLRDRMFFRLAGIRCAIGLELDEDARRMRIDSRSGEHEPEAERLLRSVSALGHLDLDRPENWNLGLQPGETSAADVHLQTWSGHVDFIAASVGTKVATKDWGEAAWRDWAQQLSRRHPNLGLALVGVQAEHARSEQLRAAWQGPAINLCGRFNPRESAAVLQRARAFVGHDSGPMHLAAAVGTPVVAVFSARNVPRTWFPYGREHRVLYHKTDCYGCGLDVCVVRRNECIRSITVEQVLAATEDVLAKHPAKVAAHSGAEVQTAP